MEWEILLSCNTMGVIILVLIVLFHLIGDDQPKNPQYIPVSYFLIYLIPK